MAKIAVLGCGLMGPVIAEDLAEGGKNQVVVADRRREAEEDLRGLDGVSFHRIDVSDVGRDAELLDGVDLVVGALPGSVGFSVLRRVLEAGCPRVVDISFMPEDASSLSELARSKGSVCFVDCGVAPGLSHMLAARLTAEIQHPEALEILVGGLPRQRHWPFEYMTVFSPRDVIEEYTRPARIKWAGKVEEWPALSRLERVEVEGVGTLEAFLTDGLRSLLSTLDIPFMVEKTLRYPGHADKIRLLRDTGFFSEDLIEVRDRRVSPLDITSRLLERAWAPRPGQDDLTVLRVMMRGSDAEGRPVRGAYEMVDVPGGKATGRDRDESRPGMVSASSMARTTGYTCTAVCRLLLRDLWKEPGVFFPEVMGSRNDLLSHLLEDLERHELHVTRPAGGGWAGQGGADR
jgi:saccharopine dehydrogenase-like NADP-dependent oxidoreductase